jgi:hypothetical protein
MKKFLISAAAIAALATSAFAYEPGDEAKYYIGNNNAAVDAAKVSKTGNKFGNAILFPLYVAGNGWNTEVKIINTSDAPIAAKIVFMQGSDSKEVLDANIYLSPKDMFVGTVTVDAAGHLVLTSTDDSVVVHNGSGVFATNANPAVYASTAQVAVNGKATGYFEVIGMAVVNGLDDPHNKSAIRQVFLAQADELRGITSENYIENGIVQGCVAAPNINLDNSTRLSVVPTDALTAEANVYSTQVVANYPEQGIGLNIYGDSNTGLLYVEGETANIADVELTQNTTLTCGGNTAAGYEANNIAADILNITGNIKEIYVPYKLSEVDSTALITTIPMKKYVATSNNPWNLNLVQKVYDNVEDELNQLYSPAQTLYATANEEVSVLQGFNANIKNAIAKANIAMTPDNSIQQDFTGFTILRNATVGASIPAIFTELKATTLPTGVATNILTPAAK